MKYIQLFILLLLGISWSLSSAAQATKLNQQRPGLDASLLQHDCGTHISSEQVDYINQELGEYRRMHKGDSERDNNATIYVPIQIHLVKDDAGNMGTDYYDTNTPQGLVTMADIDGSIAQLNEYYAPANIEFYQCSDPLEIISTELFEYTYVDEYPISDYKVADVINIFFVDYIWMNGTYWCGYTYAPNHPTYTTQGYQDDLIMMTYYCTAGFTLTHEMAHYFSVFHTHGILNQNCGTNELVNGDDCETLGDGICDTPADPNLGCWPPDANCNYTGIAYVNPDTGVAVASDNPLDANGDTYDPITNNIMSYGNWDCQAAFTVGQYDRILDGYHTFRTYLTGGTCSNTPEYDDCFTSIDLIDDIDGPASETASDYITASNVISDPAAVLMSAGNHIILEDEFHAESGSYVTAYIEGCTNSSKSNAQSKQIANELINSLSAYPNPLDNATNIEYSLTEAAKVEVAIYDINGKLVAMPLNGESKEAGSHTMTINTEDLVAGTYICTLQANSFNENIRLLIIR